MRGALGSSSKKCYCKSWSVLLTLFLGFYEQVVTWVVMKIVVRPSSLQVAEIFHALKPNDSHYL